MDASNEVTIDIHEHGVAIDDRKRKVQCNYCEKIVSGFYRLKCHLGSIRGDVTPCEKVPLDIKELIRNNLLEKKRGSLSKEVGEVQDHSGLPRKRNWSHDMNIVRHEVFENAQAAAAGAGSSSGHINQAEIMEPVLEDDSERIGGTQLVGVNINGQMDFSLREVHKCIGRFFYEQGIDFNAAESPAFQAMLNAVLSCPQIVNKIPSGKDLRGRIFQDEAEEVEEYVEAVRSSWELTGCSILFDGWTDEKGRKLVNVLADCPKGPIYLGSYDISASFDGDLNALQSVIDEVIEKVGVENVVQIMTYSTSDCMEAAGRLLKEKHRTIFWAVSASHCLELMLEKIGGMGHIKSVLEKAKTMTKFIHGHPNVLGLMRNYTDSQDLVKPRISKLAMPFLTLENIVLEQENLERMFASIEWTTSIWGSSREGKKVAVLVGDPNFWTESMIVLKAAIPLVKVMCLINEAKEPLIGYIYETMDQAKETIQNGLEYKKSEYTPYWEVIDGIWNNYLHSPLHAAGYFLNPSFQYASDLYVDPEVVSGLLCCVIRMVQDPSIQELVSFQFEEYRHGRGAFGHGRGADTRTRISPVEWWTKYGGDCPELQKLAIRILSQTCDGGSRYSLKRSVAEKLLTDSSNQMSIELPTLHYNLQLRYFQEGHRQIYQEIDPMDDWVVPENVDVELMDSDSDCR